MRLTILLSFLFFVNSLFSQQFEWGQAFGGSQNDNAQKICPGAGGSTFVTGIFNTSATIGSNALSGYGFQDVYLAKFSSTGQVIWAKAIGGAGTDLVSAIGSDAQGNVWIAGRFTGSIDLDPSASATTLTAAPAGGLDGYIAKYSGDNGSLLDFKDITAGGVLDIRSITIDHDNSDIYLGGQYTGTIDFDFGAGTQSRTSTSNSGDCFVARYAADFSYSWANTFGSTNPAIDYVSALALDSDGGIYCTGLIAGTCDIQPGIGQTNLVCVTDAFLIRYSALNGSLFWGFNLGGNSIEIGTNLCIDPDNNVIVSGTMNSASMDVDPDVNTVTISSNGISAVPFFARYAGNGAYLSSYVAEGQTGLSASINSLLYTPENALLVAGTFTGTYKFVYAADSIEVSSGDSSDAFLAFFDINNNIESIILIQGPRSQTITDARLSGAILNVCGQLDGVTQPGAGAFNPISPPNAGNEGYLFQYNLNPTAISETSSLTNLLVYPNPASSFIQIEIPDFNKLEILDLQGKCLISSESSQVAVDHLSNGMYLLRAYTSKGIVSRKWVKSLTAN